MSTPYLLEWLGVLALAHICLVYGHIHIYMYSRSLHYGNLSGSLNLHATHSLWGVQRAVFGHAVSRAPLIGRSRALVLQCRASRWYTFGVLDNCFRRPGAGARERVVIKPQAQATSSCQHAQKLDPKPKPTSGKRAQTFMLGRGHELLGTPALNLSSGLRYFQAELPEYREALEKPKAHEP